ncbi:BTAD domain-containing putative transcriptional regulator [Nonomuraea sp. C10]|uniref:AfsR/SARP family transcriptional regulator n=1 Tax=Nonomuraea sp. C10 TaxID=2600577 RepID=UPI0011CD4433|nr:BTAD domain-containing putative transcriptional regulator [Nonomuraea sp. C10]TXK43374.1 tetratricopeptide repeat protein [Nonomuraea sp. C10]
MGDRGRTVTFEVLGSLRAWLGESALALGSVQQRTVLAVLLLNANRSLTREQLIDAVWGESPPTYALNLVQKHVSGLRRVLEPGRSPRTPSRVLAWTDAGYSVLVPPGGLDLQVFESEVARARAARAEGDLQRASDVLHAALKLWRGPLCEGLVGPALTAERERLGERRVDVLEDRIDLDLALGRTLEVVNELRLLVAQHPLRERLRVLLMLALYRSGRQAEALAAFHEARRHLLDELGVEPGPQLRRVHEQILAADPQLTTAPAVRRGRLPSPAQLPYGLPDFTGREAELARLDVLCAGGGSARPVVIHALAGMGGVGKTALAVHWAHRVRHRFPDGQLYVNLRGFDPTGAAMRPAEALRGFLDTFAVPPERIPVTVEAQAALFRSLVADQRMLLILDNAESAEQVRPLLPGSAQSVVVVTSRDQLSGLVVSEGAQLLTVDTLSTEESRAFLARRLGAARVDEDPDATGVLIERCGRLPLALAIVAARAAVRPAVPLKTLAGELRVARGGLDAFRSDDRATDMRSVFSWSVHRLAPMAQRLFRLLALHPGPDITLYAAASLAGVRPADARAALAELVRANLVNEHRPGRFTLHDLLRAYAVELAGTLETEADRRAAVGRGCDHYLQTAFPADRLINPLRDPPTVEPPRPGVIPVDLTTTEEAMTWYAAEHAVLIAVVEQAVAHRLDVCAWQLGWALSTYLDRQGHWRDLKTVQLAALTAAERAGDRLGEALSHRGVARGCARLDEYDDADRHLRAALKLFNALGDKAGQAYAHRNLAALLEPQGRDAEALHHAQKALKLYRAVGHRAGEADTLNAVGWFHGRMGDHRQSLVCCEEALALHQMLDDLGGQAQTWDSLGFAHHSLGDPGQAAACYDQALRLFRELGDRYNQATTLSRLGDVREATGAGDAALEAWNEALAILTEIGHAAAQQVKARLARHRAERAASPPLW